jgi:hypothetical protein
MPYLLSAVHFFVFSSINVDVFSDAPWFPDKLYYIISFEGIVVFEII